MSEGFDWKSWFTNNGDSLSRALTAGGQLLGGGQQGPKQTGWGYLNYTNPVTGDNNLNKYTDLFQGNVNNMLMRDLGPSGYSPQAVESLWRQGLPGLNALAKDATGDFSAAFDAKARTLVAPTMEGIGQNFAGMGGLYSGAMLQAGSDATTKLGYDAMIAQEQARLSLLSPWSQQSYAGLQQGYGNVFGVQAANAEKELVTPTLAPTYGNGSFNPQEDVNENPWWQKMLSGAMSGGGIGTSVSPGWGTLIGGGIGALAGLFM